MRRPAISVISPVYNKRPFLSGCVESCLRQTLREIELIFVDDGSTDGSLDELHKLADTDSRIRVFSQENSGAALARNRGIQEAAGEFVFFLDPDDYIPETTALQRLYESARRWGTSVAGGSMAIDRGGVLDRDSLHGRRLDSFESEGVVEYCDYQYDYDYTRYIYGLDLLRDKGIKFPTLTQFEDPVFFVHVMLAAERFSTIPDVVYAYRVAYRMEGSWSAQMVLDRIAGIQELLDLSRDLKLDVLHAHLAGQLDGEMRSACLDNSDNDAVLAAMCHASASVNVGLLKSADPSAPDIFVLEAFKRMGKAFAVRRALRNTPPGRLAVFLKRKIAG